jgi:hypothetical protein
MKLTTGQIRMRRLGIQLVTKISEEQFCADCNGRESPRIAFWVLGGHDRFRPLCHVCARIKVEQGHSNDR